MDGCIFCKIVAGEISCHKVYENDQFIAFLDINPKSNGHTLVIPKTHYRWVYDVPNFGEYFEFAKLVILKLKSKLIPEHISILTLGEEIAHSHIQLVPKYQNDTPIKALGEIADKINS